MSKPMQKVILKDLDVMHPYVITVLTPTQSKFGKKYMAIIEDFNDVNFGSRVLFLNITQASSLQNIMKMDGTAIFMKIGINIFVTDAGKEMETIVLSGMSQSQYQSLTN